MWPVARRRFKFASTKIKKKRRANEWLTSNKESDEPMENKTEEKRRKKKKCDTDMWEEAEGC